MRMTDDGFVYSCENYRMYSIYRLHDRLRLNCFVCLITPGPSKDIQCVFRGG